MRNLDLDDGVGSSRFDDLHLERLHRRRSAKWSRYPPEVIPAWVAEMDFPMAEPVRQALSEAIDSHDLGYPPSPADIGLGDTVAEWADRSYGWQVEPDWVVILPDVVRGLEVGLKVLTEPGDGVVIQPPVYPPFFMVINHAGRRVVENPLVERNGRFEVDLEGLDDALSRARTFILCNPHNPTGRSFSKSELEAMAELAVRHDVTVISDEVHSPLTMPGAEHTVFVNLGAEIAARTITVTAASKAWNFGGLKCGLAVAGSPELAKRLNRLGHLDIGGASILGIAATEAAFTNGNSWMRQAVAYLDGNRHLLAELLQERLPQISYAIPDATYLGWLDCRTLDLKPDPYSFFLDRARVAFSPGPSFGTQGEGFVRFNFGTSREILTEIVDRMAEAVGSSR